MYMHSLPVCSSAQGGLRTIILWAQEAASPTRVYACVMLLRPPVVQTLLMSGITFAALFLHPLRLGCFLHVCVLSCSVVFLAHVCGQLLSRVQLLPHPLTLACLTMVRLLWPWNFSGKNTGVGYCFLLQGIFPTQESNLRFPSCRRILHPLSPRDTVKLFCCVPHSMLRSLYVLRDFEI